MGHQRSEGASTFSEEEAGAAAASGGRSSGMAFHRAIVFSDMAAAGQCGCARKCLPGKT